tara:strand:- start:1224 stop:2795 length:1572 start_codon:yes stop_codon:yes gene_type:complete
MKLQESILQIIDVGGTDISGNAKPQATKITGGPHWLQHEITEDVEETMETSVKGALEQIAKGKTYDEWAKTTKMSAEVKAEVRKRLDEMGDEEEGDEEESHGAHHQKDHITKAVFDSLPPEEQEKQQDSLRNAMKSHGLGDDEEEQQPEGEEQPQEEPPPAPQQTNGNGLDYEIEDEKKEKKEPKVKLSNKKEKVTINPKMESKEMKRKSLINELRQKHLQEKAPPGREDQVKALKSKVGKDSAYAIAWAQHNKHGKPSKEEEVVSKEVRKVDFVDGITEELTNKDGHTFVISDRGIKGKSQDKVRMHVQDKSGKKIKDWGSHVSLDQARKFAKSRGFNEMSGDMAYRAMDKAEKKSRGEMSVNDPEKAKRKAKQAQKFADYSIKKTLNKEDKDPCWKGYKQVGMKKKNGKKVPNCVPEEQVNEKYDEMKNVVQSRMSPLEIVKALKDKVDSVDPSEMRGSSWSDYEQGLQELEKMVQPGRNALMYRIRDLDTGDSGEIENFVFVMVDKIPKYKEMGYQVVAD